MRVLVAAALIALTALWVNAAGTTGSETFRALMLVGVAAPVLAAIVLVRKAPIVPG